MNVRPSPATAIFLGLLAVSCSPSDPARDAASSSSNPRGVGTAAVEARKLERTVIVTGALAALDRATLTIKVPGRLREMTVDLGSTVQPGQVIAQVDPRDYELRAQQATAALAQARAALGLPPDGTNETLNLEEISLVREARAVFNEAARSRQRVGELAQASIASASELDTVDAGFVVASNRLTKAFEDGRVRQAALAQRRSELELARQQLTDTTLRAPFVGAVEARLASVGEYITTGMPVVTLVRTDPLRLRLEVPERQAHAVQLGQSIRFQVSGDTNQFTAIISRRSPALSELNRMLHVEADVPGGPTLRPGFFVRAEIITHSDDPGLTAPLSALVVFAGLEKVVAVRDGKALEKTVTTGRRGADWVEIVSGLKAGDRVVLQPGNLRTGEAVRELAQVQGPGWETTNASSSPVP